MLAKTLSFGLPEPGRVREAVEKTLLTACPLYRGQSIYLDPDTNLLQVPQMHAIFYQAVTYEKNEQYENQQHLYITR
ncbi:hypothetical protein CH330_00930 [candidate division WOR-3 bacterium JGI_Cruoil_03_51_56]|uniref:Uncharacterized protein n=1 Tax=candidate division WOR-3 bacterium JGI_Cruoil_03_51_56 TaxID=1973747 RepID=A0A235BXV3_UNCW3|nr:MAG: hypothetical protein CH330_00930 [candidate division WOR-3 bacterium JGI_Cruoil_03_51_56]